MRTAGDAIIQWRNALSRSDTVPLEGFHAVKHALRFGAEVDLVVTSDRRAALHLVRELAPDLTDVFARRLVDIGDRYRDALGESHPTGVSAIASRPEQDLDKVAASVRRVAPAVFLDNPRNLGNIGAVVRLCAGLGVSGVLTTGTVDPWHPTVLRGSAGLNFALPVGRVGDATTVQGPIFALHPDGTDLRETAIPDNAVLTFGSERAGLSADLRERSAKLLTIPMDPRVSSYNLATSVAITLYHWLSHRRHR